MRVVRPVTILHLSDVQFGKNHIFGLDGLLPSDKLLSTLQERLKDDLRDLKKKQHLHPDLIIVTGDLTEWGMEEEFQQFGQFLNNIAEFLSLPKNRIVFIPGNHDINRNLCKAYFENCAAMGSVPTRPYWQKFQNYFQFFQDFYSGVPKYQFSKPQPWTLFELTDLNIVVAGINSCMAESHQDIDHYGHAGDEQYRWFAEKMATYESKKWLRIACVHHNINRLAQDDSENLRDAERLKQIIGPNVNIILHGHTHDGKLAWLNPRTPIISTGSAGVKKEARPEEVPNQYQMIQVFPNRIKHYARSYDVKGNRWIGDNRCSEKGDVWHKEEPTQFSNVEETFASVTSGSDRNTERSDGSPNTSASLVKRSATKKSELSQVGPVDAEQGFTSDVIRDPVRFVGRTDVIRDCIKALHTPLGLIAVYGKRGVGKSSLLRQVQRMALGDTTLARKAGIEHLVPKRSRSYVTVYYTCDSMIKDINDLLNRLCNDQDPEDGLLRLVPDDDKKIVEFSRSKDSSANVDLKVQEWGKKGILSSKYARIVPGDIVQTFRNYVTSIVEHQVKRRMKRDALLIILDEFDTVVDKSGIGSLIKSMSNESVKFAICGVARDLSDLVKDHGSVERLLEEGAIHVKPMQPDESANIIHTAELLFKGKISFETEVISSISKNSDGYPYLTQLFGKECVEFANRYRVNQVDKKIFQEVMEDVKAGKAFPTLETNYQRAIGDSTGRQILLHLLADQPENNTLFNDEIGRVVLRNIREDARELNVDYVDQLVPRLIDKSYGPVLERVLERPGVYEFVNPVFRVYVRLRAF